MAYQRGIIQLPGAVPLSRETIYCPTTNTYITSEQCPALASTRPEGYYTTAPGAGVTNGGPDAGVNWKMLALLGVVILLLKD